MESGQGVRQNFVADMAFEAGYKFNKGRGGGGTTEAGEYRHG